MKNEHMELISAFSTMLDERDIRWKEDLDQRFSEHERKSKEDLDQRFLEYEQNSKEDLEQRFSDHEVKWKVDINQILDKRFRESENMVLSEIERVHESLIEHKKDTKANFEQVNRRMDDMQQKMDQNHNEILQAYSFIRSHEERIGRLEQKVS